MASLREDIATIARKMAPMNHRLYPGDGCPVCGERLELRHTWSILHPLRLRKYLRCLGCDFVAMTRRDSRKKSLAPEPAIREPRMGNSL
jgi:hypothetical protein